MHNSDSPYLADLFVISMRWMILFGIASVVYTGESMSYLMALALWLPALWNGYVSLLAVSNRRLNHHRLLNIGLDILFAMALFAISGGATGGLFWAALLPLVSGSIYYELRGAAAVVVIMSLLQGAFVYLFSGGEQLWLNLALVGGFNLVTGALTALLARLLLRRLRQKYQNTLNRRKERDSQVQQKERDRLRSLFQMVETFSATLNYTTVLETALEMAITAAGGGDEAASSETAGAQDSSPAGISGSGTMIGAVLLFGDSGLLEVRAGRGLAMQDHSVKLTGETGVLRETLKAGEAVLVENPGQDDELGKMVALQARSIALCLPLIRGVNAYGIMLFAHENANFFTDERVETLQMLCNQAIIAIQNSRLYQELAHEKERLVQSQEEAQKKLARDLHDGPTQSISAVAMRISIVRKVLEKAPLVPPVIEALRELEKIENLARQTTQEIRHMLFTMRPLVLESEGIIAALETMADKMFELYKQLVVIEADPAAADRLDPSRQTVVFSLAEEAVNNARKHAQAREIRVRIRFPGDERDIVLLEIIDNGCGFDVQSVMSSYERRGSLGMVNLQERAELVDGLLKIDSVPGKGTRVRVFLPLTDEAADRLHRGSR